MSKTAHLGNALRSLRNDNGWTLAEVSAKTGLSISTLSKTERNQLSLTYDKLVALSQGLGVDITTFFRETPPNGSAGQAANGTASGRRSINRLDDGQAITTPNYEYVYLSTELLNKKFVPIVAEIHARSLDEFGPLVSHEGEEFAYVLEGSVEVHTELYAPTVLQTGESIYFDSRMAHAYVACGDGPCRVRSVCSSPEASLMESIQHHFGQAASGLAETA